MTIDYMNKPLGQGNSALNNLSALSGLKLI